MSKDQNNYNPFANLKKSDFPDKPLGKSDKDAIPKTKIITPKETKFTYPTSKKTSFKTSPQKEKLSQNTLVPKDETAIQDEADSSLFFANMGQVQKLTLSTKELKRKERAEKLKKNNIKNNTNSAHTIQDTKPYQEHERKENIDKKITPNEIKRQKDDINTVKTNSYTEEKFNTQDHTSPKKQEATYSQANTTLQDQMLALKKSYIKKVEQENKKSTSQQRSKTTIITSKNKSSAEKADKLEDDDTLFFNALADVKSINTKGRDIPLTPVQAPENIVNTHNANPKPLNPYQEIVNNSLEIALHTSEDYIEAHVLGLDLITLSKLQAREYKPEAHIDLHGLTVEHAYNNLIAFFRNAYQRGLRTVLVVTGKGKNSINNMPILRTKACEWFTQDPFKRVILAFCTAKIEDGGAGALYVLIRKPKKDYGPINWNVTPSDTDLFS